MRTGSREQLRDFRLDGLEIRPGLREVVGPEWSATVESLSMDVLLLLVHRPGELVSRDEILNAVWGSQSVTEEVLTHADLHDRLKSELSGVSFRTIYMGWQYYSHPIYSK